MPENNEMVTLRNPGGRPIIGRHRSLFNLLHFQGVSDRYATSYH